MPDNYSTNTRGLTNTEKAESQNSKLEISKQSILNAKNYLSSNESALLEKNIIIEIEKGEVIIHPRWSDLQAAMFKV